MRWLVETLQGYPEVAIFLALAVGFAIDGIKLGKFSLGNVTGVLIAGAFTASCGGKTRRIALYAL
jgi:putative transport protein